MAERRIIDFYNVEVNLGSTVEALLLKEWMVKEYPPNTVVALTGTANPTYNVVEVVESMPLNQGEGFWPALKVGTKGHSGHLYHHEVERVISYGDGREDPIPGCPSNRS